MGFIPVVAKARRDVHGVLLGNADLYHPVGKLVSEFGRPCGSDGVGGRL